MTKNRNVAPQAQPDAFADLLPDVVRRNRALGKNRAPGIGFRLEADHAPDVGPLRIGQIPAQHFRDIIDVLARDGEAEGILQGQAGFGPHPQSEISEGLPHGMKIGLRFNQPDWIPMPAGLGHVDVDGNLS